MGLNVAIGLLATMLLIAAITIAVLMIYIKRTQRPAQKQTNENVPSENVNPAFNNDATYDTKEGDQYETLDARRPGYEAFTVHG